MTMSSPTTMTQEHWRLVDQVLHDALICTRDHRDAFIANSCGDDAGLRAEVSSLLAAYDALPSDFLEHSAMQERGMGSPPHDSATAPGHPRRLVPAAVVTYVAAAAILLGTLGGWGLAHSATVDRWIGTFQAISRSTASTSASAAGATTRAQPSAGSISPHKHWIAYTANEFGRDEVYVDEYPRPGYRTRISQQGGVDPQWRGDGRELYYWRGDAFIAVAIDGSQTDRPPILGAERVLFTRQTNIR